MSVDFDMKQGDSKPSLRAVLNDDGVALDLTGTTVRLKIRRANEATFLINEAVVLEDAPNGIVRYDWATDDLDTAERSYQAEFEVTYADDTVLTVPRPGFLHIFVHPDLD